MGGVGRASTTGAELSPPRHTRGVSVDTASPNAAALSTSTTSPPKGADRKRQASLSGTSSSRRSRAAASSAFGEPLPEENESAVVVDDDGHDDHVDAPGSLDSKPVYLKGLFSVATTSTKSPAAIRESIVRVLDQLGVTHRPIRAGFECAHAPSIDLSSVAFSPRPETGNDRLPPFSSSPESPSLDRRRSSRRSTRIGMPRSPFSKDKDLDKEGGSSTGANDRSESSLPRNHRTTASSSSFTVLSNPSAPATPGRGLNDVTAFTAAPHSPTVSRKSEQPHPITDVSMPSDAHDMIVRFEIFIIKVPWLPGLHGLQFRRISGSAWQYSQLARTVLNELNL